MQCTKNISLGK